MLGPTVLFLASRETEPHGGSAVYPELEEQHQGSRAELGLVTSMALASPPRAGASYSASVSTSTKQNLWEKRSSGEA